MRAGKRARSTSASASASASASSDGRGTSASDGASDEETSASSSTSSELDLALDERGRVACALNRYLAYGATVADGFARERDARAPARDALERDCLAAHVAKARRKRSSYSRGRTFWVPASESFSPRCALEALARETFERATRRAAATHAAAGASEADDARAAYDPENSGAEWWTQVIDDDSEIGWHWDKDYALEGSELNVHPQLGTVTYFCDGGAPTVIVDRPTDYSYDEEDGDIGVCGDVCNCAISWPEWGKQITFDGKLLHGAPGELAREQTRSGKRITFLVNVWLNHKPLTAEVLSEDDVAAMELRDVESAKAWVANSKAAEPVEATEVQGETHTYEFRFLYAERERKMKLNLPRQILKDPTGASTSRGVSGTTICLSASVGTALGALL